MFVCVCERARFCFVIFFSPFLQLVFILSNILFSSLILRFELLQVFLLFALKSFESHSHKIECDSLSVWNKSLVPVVDSLFNRKFREIERDKEKKKNKKRTTFRFYKKQVKNENRVIVKL